MKEKSFLAELSKIYPQERLLTKPAQLVPYESDALTSFQVRPLAVVLPEKQEEVIDTVRLCYLHEIPFVARGSGTSLSGGSLPIADRPAAIRCGRYWPYTCLVAKLFRCGAT